MLGAATDAVVLPQPKPRSLDHPTVYMEDQRNWFHRSAPAGTARTSQFDKSRTWNSDFSCSKDSQPIHVR